MDNNKEIVHKLEEIVNFLKEKKLSKNIPQYDPRKAASHFSTLSTLIATMTFTVMVLVFNLTITSPEVILAGISFLVPLIGCLFSTAVFGVVEGEKVLSLRTHVINFLAAIGFIPSIGYLFFGLGWIFRAVGNPLFQFAFFIIIIIYAFVSPVFLTTSLVDQFLFKKAELYKKERNKKRINLFWDEIGIDEKKKYIILDLISYLIVLIGIIIGLVNYFNNFIKLSFEDFFICIGVHAFITLSLIIAANWIAMIKSNNNPDKEFKFHKASIYVIFASTLSSSLLFLFTFRIL